MGWVAEFKMALLAFSIASSKFAIIGVVIVLAKIVT